MVIKQLSNLPAASKGYSAWTRPTDWLALPTLVAGDQKVVALAAVFNQSTGNLFAVNCAGAYSVDWGDGTVDLVATGVTKTHQYSFASLSSATVNSEGARQAIVTITPQAGQTLTSIAMNGTPTGATAGYVQQWRDIAIVGANVSSLTLNDSNGLRNAASLFTYVGPSALTAINNSLRSTPMLRMIVGTQWTRLVTNFSQAFTNCANLETVPLFDTSAAQDMSNMFSTCTRLRTVPLFSTSAVTNMSTMFSNCPSLQSVPLFDTSLVTNMSSMFLACVSLTTIPLFNTAKVTNFSLMFSGCTSLSAIPAIVTTAGTTFGSMFNNCASLATMPASLDTAKGTDLSSMFTGCTSLMNHPAMSAAAATTLNSMFTGCSSLQAVNLPTSSLAVSMTNVINNCGALLSVNLNCSAVTSSANFSLQTSAPFAAGITSYILTGLRFAPSASTGISNNQLSAAALNALYASLGTASGAQTLTVSGNPGSGSSTTSTATAKGWTVVGG